MDHVLVLTLQEERLVCLVLSIISRKVSLATEAVRRKESKQQAVICAVQSGNRAIQSGFPALSREALVHGSELLWGFKEPELALVVIPPMVGILLDALLDLSTS